MMREDETFTLSDREWLALLRTQVVMMQAMSERDDVSLWFSRSMWLTAQVFAKTCLRMERLLEELGR